MSCFLFICAMVRVWEWKWILSIFKNRHWISFIECKPNEISFAVVLLHLFHVFWVLVAAVFFVENRFDGKEFKRTQFAWINHIVQGLLYVLSECAVCWIGAWGHAHIKDFTRLADWLARESGWQWYVHEKLSQSLTWKFLFHSVKEQRIVRLAKKHSCYCFAAIFSDWNTVCCLI